MVIHIENLSFDTIVGILPFERETPQSVILHVKIKYDFNGKDFIDYAHVCQCIQDDMNSKHYLLLEDALDGIYKTLLISYPYMKSIRIKIFKPTILQNAIVGVSHTFKIDKN
jgi:dihydroneopterin aldolase